jgi:outer membrane biogenesis lipoprotein LolB
MTTLRQKVLVLVSAIVVTLAIVVLPGCAKKAPVSPKQTQKKSIDKKAGIE